MSLAAAMAVAAAPLVSFAQARGESPVTPGFTRIFDGKSTAGWHGCPHLHPDKYADATEEQKKTWADEVAKHWSIQGDEVVNDGHGAYLTTDKAYGDMEFKIKYKTVPLADSGIYLRGTPQVQIWDTTEEAKFKLGANLGSGALWNNSAGAAGKDPLVKADRPFGEWNEVHVIQVGARTTVKLNGQLVVDNAIMENFWDRKAPLPRTGVIQLQTHGGEIRWKDIEVREIGPEEANKILAARDPKGFEPIFDGKSLAGWKGAVDDYEVADGAIQCKKGRGGNLFTEGTYDHYVVRAEFQLPPGGNSGFAIHYSGSGNPAHDGMTELQVLDNDAEKYSKLDQRQYHGSAYGMVPAARGYLRENGQWNFQEMTINGSKVRVELNGSVILDTDLEGMKEFMGDQAHPGVGRRNGHFGFAGHSDPVRFRNLSIRKLSAEKAAE
jgi:hypothetical protein